MTFTGKFTKKGNYAISVNTSGANFNCRDDSANANVKTNDNNNSINNSVAVNNVNIKSTGIPIAALLIDLVLTFAPYYRRKTQKLKNFKI